MFRLFIHRLIYMALTLAAVSVVAAGHWAGSRVLDAADALVAGARRLTDMIRGR